MTTPRHVFLARHGETDWNAAGRLQGQTDVPLNETGCAQASALAERLRREGIAAIATSDLQRARATAEIVARALGLDVALVDPDLREQRFGRFEGLTRSECQRRFPEEWARYVDGSSPPGGEPTASLLARAVASVERIAGRLRSPALVITHGGVMRAVLGAAGIVIPGAGASPAVPRRIPNGGVYRVTVSAGQVVDAAPLEG